jgi:hypothetical protein
MTQPAAPRPPKKRMSGGQIACLVIALCGVGALALGGGMCAMMWGAFSKPRDAGHAFLQQIRDGKYDEAYRKTAEGFRDDVSLDEWDAMRGGDLLTEIHESDDATFNQMKIDNDRGCLSGTLSPRGGAINLTLVHEDGKWRVAKVSRESCRN